MLINTIEPIIPAIIGYTIFGLILLYFVSSRIYSYLISARIYSYLISKKGRVIISSFFFIISGFLFQIIFDNLSILKNFASEYKDFFSLPILTVPATVLSTTLGIFFGNKILKSIAQKKEQKEISIIFINMIDSQIKCMQFIEDYLSDLKNLEINANESLKIDLSELSEDKYFNTAFERIGIYSEKEINCISYYSTQKQQLISKIKILLLDYQNSNIGLKDFIDKNDQKFKTIDFLIIQTKLLGMLCLIQMSSFYSSEKLHEEIENFKHFFENEYKKFEEIDLTISKKLCDDMMKTFMILKDYYPKKYTKQSRIDKNFYIYILELDVKTINKIFDSNLQIHKYINDSKNIFSFGKSEEKAKNNVKEKLRELIKEKLGLFPSEITSTDIENYHNQLNANIDNLFQKLNKEVKNITPWQ